MTTGLLDRPGSTSEIVDDLTRRELLTALIGAGLAGASAPTPPGNAFRPIAAQRVVDVDGQVWNQGSVLAARAVLADIERAFASQLS